MKAPIEILKVAEESLHALKLFESDKRAALIKSDRMDEKMVYLTPANFGRVKEIYTASEKYKQFEKVLIPIQQTEKFYKILREVVKQLEVCGYP